MRSVGRTLGMPAPESIDLPGLMLKTCVAMEDDDDNDGNLEARKTHRRRTMTLICINISCVSQHFISSSSIWIPVCVEMWKDLPPGGTYRWWFLIKVYFSWHYHRVTFAFALFGGDDKPHAGDGPPQSTVMMLELCKRRLPMLLSILMAHLVAVSDVWILANRRSRVQMVYSAGLEAQEDGFQFFCLSIEFVLARDLNNWANMCAIVGYRMTGPRCDKALFEKRFPFEYSMS